MYISEAVEDIAFPKMTEIGCDQRADTIWNGISACYSVRLIGKMNALGYDAKHLVVPKVLQRRIIV